MTATDNNWTTLQEQLDQIQKPHHTLRLCQDADVRSRYLKAKRDAEQIDAHLTGLGKDADPDARALLTKQAATAKTELAAAQKAYDQKTVKLRFTALERQELELLQKQHPATEQDEAIGDDYAMDTFAPALISAASLDGMPVDYARKCLNTWSPADAKDLWNAAWSIQHRQRTDLGKD